MPNMAKKPVSGQKKAKPPRDEFNMKEGSLVESLGLGAVDLPKLPGGQDAHLGTSVGLMGTTGAF